MTNGFNSFIWKHLCFHSSVIFLLAIEFWLNISFFFKALKMLFVFLYSMVSDENLIIWSLFPWLWYVIFLVGFKICSLSLAYSGLLCTLAGLLCVHSAFFLFSILYLWISLSWILRNFHPLFLQIFSLSPLHLLF